MKGNRIKQFSPLSQSVALFSHTCSQSLNTWFQFICSYTNNNCTIHLHLFDCLFALRLNTLYQQKQKKWKKMQVDAGYFGFTVGPVPLCPSSELIFQGILGPLIWNQ